MLFIIKYTYTFKEEKISMLFIIKYIYTFNVELYSGTYWAPVLGILKLRESMAKLFFVYWYFLSTDIVAKASHKIV